MYQAVLTVTFTVEHLFAHFQVNTETKKHNLKICYDIIENRRTGQIAIIKVQTANNVSSNCQTASAAVNRPFCNRMYRDPET